MKTAWFGEQALKDRAMEQLREHRRLDQIVQRNYWLGDRSCHLGCLTHMANGTHEATEQMFGIPIRVAYWLEAVFERLPGEKCAWWVIEATNAIPVGADLSLCHHQLAAWLLSDESPSAHGNAHPIVAVAIDDIRQLNLKAASGVLRARPKALCW